MRCWGFSALRMRGGGADRWALWSAGHGGAGRWACGSPKLSGPCVLGLLATDPPFTQVRGRPEPLRLYCGASLCIGIPIGPRRGPLCLCKALRLGGPSHGTPSRSGPRRPGPRQMQRSRSDWIPREHPVARAQPIWGVVAVEASVRLITSVHHCHAGLSGLDHPEPLRE